MQYDANTPKANLTIEGYELQAVAPFAEGHVVNANEAAVLNQTLRENLRNNLASKVSAAKEEAAKNGGQLSTEAVQEMLDKYTLEYEFGVRKAGGGATRVTDPVERAARSIARTRISAKVKALGHKVKDIPADQFNGWIDALLQKDKAGSGEIYAAAKTIVETQKEVGAAEFELDLEEKAA